MDGERILLVIKVGLNSWQYVPSDICVSVECESSPCPDIKYLSRVSDQGWGLVIYC